MKLTSILDKNHITTRAKVTTKEEAIDLVLRQFATDFNYKRDLNEIKNAILEREKLGGTLFDNGMAIPHARLEGFSDLFVGIVIPEAPIHEPDGGIIHCLIIFLTIKAGSSMYLKTLAAFAAMAGDPNRYKRFLSCQNREEILQVLDDIHIQKELSVRDIMTGGVVSVKPSASLKELINLMYTHKMSYVPVVEEEDTLVGEVDIIDLLNIGIPNYAVMIGKLDFLTRFEPFEELLNNEEKIKVSDIMRKIRISLKAETTIIETALEMTKNNRRNLPVAENGKIIGVVSYMDLLSKVLRA